jgi:hypothetical protein
VSLLNDPEQTGDCTPVIAATGRDRPVVGTVPVTGGRSSAPPPRFGARTTSRSRQGIAEPSLLEPPGAVLPLTADPRDADLGRLAEVASLGRRDQHPVHDGAAGCCRATGRSWHIPLAAADRTHSDRNGVTKFVCRDSVAAAGIDLSEGVIRCPERVLDTYRPSPSSFADHSAWPPRNRPSGGFGNDCSVEPTR